MLDVRLELSQDGGDVSFVCDLCEDLKLALTHKGRVRAAYKERLGEETKRRRRGRSMEEEGNRRRKGGREI